MKRFFTVAVAALVILATGGATPTGSTTAAESTPGLISPGLSMQLALDPSAEVTTFVRGSSAVEVEAAVTTLGLPVLGRWNRFGVVSTRGTAEQLDRLRRAAGVDFLEEDRKLSWATETSHTATRGEEASTFTYEEIVQPPPLPDKPGKRKGQVRKQPPPTIVSHGPFDGAGVSIAIVDSGIDGTNPMFIDPGTGRSKVVRNVKYAGESPSGSVFADLTSTTNDTDGPSMGGHGTHVAGTAGGYEVVTTAGDRLRGAAPGAALVGVSGGQLISMAFALSSLEWVIENQIPCAGCPPIRVVNNSWGSGGARHDPSSAIAVAVNTLVGEGITVVFAAGNDGAEALEVQTGPDSTNPTPGVISVANLDDADSGSRNGPLNSSSSKGKHGDARTYPDVTAPGTDIRAACRPTLPVCYLGLDPAPQDVGYYELTGTSMAAPHVAGIVAVLLSANPALTPAQVEDILEDTAYRSSRGGPYHLDEVRNHRGELVEAFNDTPTSANFGHGVVDVAAALAAAVSAPAPAGDTTFCASSNGAVTRDSAGDAVSSEVSRPQANTPELDLLSVRFGWDSTTSALTGAFQVGSLAPTLGTTTAAGTRHEIDLMRGTDLLRLRVSRTATATTSELIRVAGSVVLARGSAAVVPGSPGELTFNIPDSGIVRNAQQVPAMASFQAGEQLLPGFVASRRAVGAGFLLTDTADGACPYLVGQGTLPPLGEVVATPLLAKPAVDATLNPGQSFTWTDSRIGSADVGYLCGRCTARALELQVPAGGETFEVRITPGVGTGDLTVAVADERLRQVARGTNGVSVVLPQSGIYTVTVVPTSVAVQSGYKATAQLGSVAGPAPEPVEVSSPRLQNGERYKWESEPFLLSSLSACTGPDDPVCDRHDIELVVPAGTPSPTLLISITAGPADDYDLTVYPPGGGAPISVGAFGSNEKVEIPNAVPGVYTVVVSPYAVTPGSSYRGTAEAR